MRIRQSFLVVGVRRLRRTVVYGFQASRLNENGSRRDFAGTVVTDNIVIVGHVLTGGVFNHEKNLVFVFPHIDHFKTEKDIDRMGRKKTVRSIFVGRMRFTVVYPLCGFSRNIQRTRGNQDHAFRDLQIVILRLIHARAVLDQKAHGVEMASRIRKGKPLSIRNHGVSEDRTVFRVNGIRAVDYRFAVVYGLRASRRDHDGLFLYRQLSVNVAHGVIFRYVLAVLVPKAERRRIINGADRGNGIRKGALQSVSFTKTSLRDIKPFGCQCFSVVYLRGIGNGDGDL